MVKHNMRIIIIDDSKGEKCYARCGVDWSSAEVADLAREQIKERFGEGIKLEYIDLSEAATGNRLPELDAAIRKNKLPLPVLLINGEPRISGEFDIRLLLDAIDTEVEIKS